MYRVSIAIFKCGLLNHLHWSLHYLLKPFPILRSDAFINRPVKFKLKLLFRSNCTSMKFNIVLLFLQLKIH